MKTRFDNFLKKTSAAVNEYYSSLEFKYIAPPELKRGVGMYFERGGKRLRPGILSLCAGATGGADAVLRALPAACAVELYHNWTLIHDDLIDGDNVRRGGPSVHKATSDEMPELISGVISREDADKYGAANAILSGDALHAAAISVISSMKGVSDTIKLKLVTLMEDRLTGSLLEGEALDTRFGIVTKNLDSMLTITEDKIIDIMRKKTGELFGYAAVCGAIIGLDLSDDSSEIPEALRGFAEDCGVAFQLADDVLGIISDEETLGKPIGGDIREGKNTLVLRYGYNNASEDNKQILRSVVGNRNAGSDDIKKAVSILINSGGIEYAKKRGSEYIASARKKLTVVQDSEYKELLNDWADMMIFRIR
ncbi:MAG: polyprenyl synthetase family protein [Oscillospiraceae bacterium]|nr:polyprenyl synthetase family protein [Oscillospiraceae bacterium]